MKKFLVLCLFSFVSSNIFAQQNALASFPQGDSAFDAYIYKNLFTTDSAIKNKTSGIVKVKFTITEGGFVENVMLVNGIGFGCDEQAIKMISEMPRWTAGIYNTVAIKSTFSKNISFTLSTPIGKGKQLAETKVMIAKPIEIIKYENIVPEKPKEVVSQNTFEMLKNYLKKNFTMPKSISKKWEGDFTARFYLDGYGKVIETKIIAGADATIDSYIINLLGNFKGIEPPYKSIQKLASNYTLQITFAKNKIMEVFLKP